MPVLTSEQREMLKNTVVRARYLAELGARDALTALAVGASEPFASMDEEQRRLRNRLRAHGRQLGDQRDPQKGTQGIERLVREMAYAHWHRMLFARFLAENQLLIEPSSGVAISLDECEELAAEEGTDLWGLAAQFAQAMLPQIFRVDDPVLAAKLPIEISQKLRLLVAQLNAEVFAASDSLGWSYQFWQSRINEKVKKLMKSGVKVGADEIAPVTQYFTEDYMVDFLLHNSLGAWWVTRHPGEAPPVPLRYLRLKEGGTPIAGNLESWPDNLSELTILDPCCGSGHFLVAAFLLLVPMRIASEGLSAQEAVDAVLLDNLHGLELDSRCVAIAVFALALAAWRYPDEDGVQLGFRLKMPCPKVACSGLSPTSSADKWKSLIPVGCDQRDRLQAGLTQLHNCFLKAPLLGSLLHPRRLGEANLLTAGYDELSDLLKKALEREAMSSDDNDSYSGLEAAFTAKGLADAAILLDRKYHLVATNVPYLGSRDQSKSLKDFCAKEYPDAKSDLANVFLERCLELTQSNGAGLTQVVMPQNWLFLGSYLNMRRELLSRRSIHHISLLGEKAFQTPIGTSPILITIGTGHRIDGAVDFLTAQASKTTSGKSEELMNGPIVSILEDSLLKNPDSRISLHKIEQGESLGEYAECYQGIVTGDKDAFIRKFWELPEFGYWELMSTANNSGQIYGGMSAAIHWEAGRGRLHKYAAENRSRLHDMHESGNKAWGRLGVTVNQQAGLECSPYLGTKFEGSASVIVPKNAEHLLPILCFCTSEEFKEEVRKLDEVRKVTNKTFLKVPFELDKWRNIAEFECRDGFPGPFSDAPDQWLFHGHPQPAMQTMQVAVARLVGYRWPAETYPNIELSDEAHEWISRCKVLALHADNDGIVCLPSVRGELAAAERTSKLLISAFGDDWSSTKERELLLEAAAVNNTRKPEPTLEAWLRNSFFAEHCKLFHGRPFVWQIWDGNPAGFAALVNAHKLAAPGGYGRKTLEQLTYTYLGDWIDRQKYEQSEGGNGADDRLAAALDLQAQLKKILNGEPPYDIFVRWKPLHQQAIGWEPDLDDGVRLNIRPFLNAKLRKGGIAGAGILRAKPGKIKWSLDSGKEPMRSKEEFPWFWGWDENNSAMATDFGAPVPGAPPAGDSFDGNRWNDLHYTRAAKEAARARHRGEG